METVCLAAASQLTIIRHTDSSAHFKIKPYICAQSKPTVQISRSQPLIPSPPPSVLPRVAPDSLWYPAGFLGAAAKSEEREGGATDAMWHVTGILTSKVYDVAIESPLEFAPKLSRKLGVNVWLKREDLQPRGVPHQRRKNSAFALAAVTYLIRGEIIQDHIIKFV